jgi:hypothetical protein
MLVADNNKVDKKGRLSVIAEHLSLFIIVVVSSYIVGLLVG